MEERILDCDIETETKIKNEMNSNAEPYIIGPTDTIYSIARGLGVLQEDLINFNRLNGKKFKYRGKNKIIIKENENIVVPKNVELFKEQIKELNIHYKFKELNENITSGNLSKLRGILDYKIFPTRVLSTGLPHLADRFLDMERNYFNPQLPRGLDESGETGVSCAYLIRAHMGQSLNSKDLKPEEKLFFQKKDINAWGLPEELMKIGFNQEQSDLMNYFDPSKIGANNPIKNGELENYEGRVLDFGQYLDDNAEELKGSLVPYYFTLSSYKNNSIHKENNTESYNRHRKDGEKHYNTHQSLVLGKGEKEFQAYEVGEVKSGAIKDFGTNVTDIEKQIIDNYLRVENIQSNLQSKLLPILKSKKIEYGKINYSHIDEVLLRFYGTGEAARKKVNKTKRILEQGGKLSEISGIISSELVISMDDARYIYTIYHKSNYSIDVVGMLEEVEGKVNNNHNLEYIDGPKIMDDELKSAMEDYNYRVTRVKVLNEEMRKLQDSKRKGIESNDISEKQISAIDFVLNFIQTRADYKGSLEEENRDRYLEGLSKYGELVNIKIDGVPINIKEELAKKEIGAEETMVKPNSKIEISNVMMMDGEHMWNSKNQDEVEKMNTRGRFLFEFLVTQDYLPTELLVPGEDSSFKKREFGNISDKLIKKWPFSMKKGDVFSQVLRKQIIIQEGLQIPDFSEPEFEKKSEELEKKIDHYYSKQIKALQLAGYINSSGEFNVGAGYINRTIMYYDTTNIDEIYREYIKSKRDEISKVNESVANMKEFVNIFITPGFTDNLAFEEIRKQVNESGLCISDKFENLKLINSLNEFQITYLLRQFKQNAKVVGKTDNKKPDFVLFNTYLLDFKTLDEILSKINIRGVEEREAKNREQQENKEIINFVPTNDRHKILLEQTMYMESGEGWKRKNFKLALDAVNDKYINKPIFETLDYIVKQVNGGNITKDKIYDIINKLEGLIDDLEIPEGILDHVNKIKTMKLLETGKIPPQINRLNQLLQSGETDQEKIKNTILGVVDELASIIDYRTQSTSAFQIRIDNLRYGYGKEWLTREQIKKMIETVKSEKFKEYVSNKANSNKDKSIIARYESDMKIVGEIEQIVEKENPTKYDFILLLDKIRNLISLDADNYEESTIDNLPKVATLLPIPEKEGPSMVGKLAGAMLQDKKFDTHDRKMYWNLIYAGEDIGNIIGNKENMEGLDKIEFLANHFSEGPTMQILFENYILRLLESSGITIITKTAYLDESKNGDNSIKSTIKWFLSSGGKINYDKGVFVEHIKDYLEQAKKQEQVGTNEGNRRLLIQKLEKFLATITPDESLEDQSDDKKIKPHNTAKNITSFFSDPEIRGILKDKGINDSIIPTREEFIGRGKQKLNHFRMSIFSYLLKMDGKTIKN